MEGQILRTFWQCQKLLFSVSSSKTYYWILYYIAPIESALNSTSHMLILFMWRNIVWYELASHSTCLRYFQYFAILPFSTMPSRLRPLIQTCVAFARANLWQQKYHNYLRYSLLQSCVVFFGDLMRYMC